MEVGGTFLNFQKCILQIVRVRLKGKGREGTCMTFQKCIFTSIVLRLAFKGKGKGGGPF